MSPTSTNSDGGELAAKPLNFAQRRQKLIDDGNIIAAIESQLPDAMFSRFGYPDEWDTRTWAVHFSPKQWRAIIPKLKAAESRKTKEAEIRAVTEFCTCGRELDSVCSKCGSDECDCDDLYPTPAPTSETASDSASE